MIEDNLKGGHAQSQRTRTKDNSKNNINLILTKEQQ
jgi:hypothetical protein